MAQQQRLLSHVQGRSQGQRALGASYVEGGQLASPRRWRGGGVARPGEAEVVNGGMARWRLSAVRNFGPDGNEDDHDHERCPLTPSFPTSTAMRTSGDHHLYRIESVVAISSLNRIESVIATSSLCRIENAVASSFC
jgi:hypothetical protein